MATDAGSRLRGRVVRAAEAALAERSVVSPIDVLVGIGWLAPPDVDRWQQGRTPCLKSAVQVDAGRVAAALEHLWGWAEEHGLRPSVTAYVAHP